MHAKLNDIEIASKAYQEVINTYPLHPIVHWPEQN